MGRLLQKVLQRAGLSKMAPPPRSTAQICCFFSAWLPAFAQVGVTCSISLSAPALSLPSALLIPSQPHGLEPVCPQGMEDSGVIRPGG